MLQMTNLSTKDKEKWMAVMQADFMSSESSDDSDTDKLITKNLEWRSTKVTDFFKALDEGREELRSPMAKRQAKTRVFSSVASSRSIPADGPKWAIDKSTQFDELKS